MIGGIKNGVTENKLNTIEEQETLLQDRANLNQATRDFKNKTKCNCNAIHIEDWDKINRAYMLHRCYLPKEELIFRQQVLDDVVEFISKEYLI